LKAGSEQPDVHERLSLNSICFWGATFQELAGHWRTLAPRRVSMMSHEILKEGVPAIQEVLKTGSYRLETIAHPFLPFKPLELHEASWRESRATLSQLIRSAAQLGARSIYLLTGGHGTLTWEQAAAAFAEAVAPSVVQAKDEGIALAIENSSVLYADNHIAHSLRDTITLAELAGVGVCMDLYLCWPEAGLHELIERAMPRLHVVQVSDYVYGDRALPCRAVPGDGAVPFKRIFEWLLSAGYTGAFDFELIGPRIDKEGHLKAARRASHYIEAVLRELGV
jgi:sugar phosphate isomerase/epimerase